MNDHRQKIIDNFEQYRIGLEDTFAFKCRNCGKCCKNRDDILLNSRDVFNVAGALNLSNEKTIEKYCETYIGQNSRVPIIRLKPVGNNKVCPLLSGNRCLVHSLKPTVSAAYPIGRVFAFANMDNNESLVALEFRPNEIQYVLNQVSCGSAKRRQTVREWLEMFNIPIDDTFFLEWNKAVQAIGSFVRKFEEKPGASAKILNVLLNAICVDLYLNYDSQKEFQPQFESNVTRMHEAISKFQEML